MRAGRLLERRDRAGTAGAAAPRVSAGTHRGPARRHDAQPPRRRLEQGRRQPADPLARPDRRDGIPVSPGWLTRARHQSGTPDTERAWWLFTDVLTARYGLPPMRFMSWSRSQPWVTRNTASLSRSIGS